MERSDELDFKLLEEYDLTEKITHIVRHVLTKVPPDNKEKFLVNYINSIVGSAVLHHDNKYVKKLQVGVFKDIFSKK
jgi:uncharacterized protein (UPF0297 family)